MTRSEMASFIRKIAAESYTQAEWDDVMLNTYVDIPTDHVRALVVDIYNDPSEVSANANKQFLLGLARSLEFPTDDLDFYFKGGAAGRLQEFPSSAGSVEIGYEPYRSGSHYDMQMMLKSEGNAYCELMRDGRRVAFKIIGCPSYGKLAISMSA